MSDPRRRRPVDDRGAYTGETVVMPRVRPGERPSEQPPAPPPAPPPRPPGRRPLARRRRPIWGWLRLILAFTLLGLLVGAGLLYWQIHSLAAAIVVSDPRPGVRIASPLVGANLLLVGVDERPGHPEEGVRSDTLILTRLDAAGGWVSLLSIPRDTQVESMLDIGTTKINVAYGQGHARAAELYGASTSPQQGGMALAAETVEGFLNLRQRSMGVDYTAQVNFDGFAGLIDALGGVTIDVPILIIDDEYPTPDFGITRVEFQPGSQRMDGARALIYARTRHADSDFGRAERQQQVLRAILAEFQAKNRIGQLLAVPGLLRAVGGNGGPPPVLTTMPIDRIDVLFGLLGLASGLNPDTIGQLSLNPADVGLSEAGSNLIWDAAGVQALLDRWARPPSLASEDATVQVLNGTETAGLARSISLELESAGYKLVVPDNAPSSDYPRTLIYDMRGNPATSARLAKQLDGEVRRGALPEGIFSDADIVVILGANTQEP